MVDTQHYCQVHTHLHHPYPHYYRHDAGEYILNWLVARWPSGSHTLALSSRWFLSQENNSNNKASLLDLQNYQARKTILHPSEYILPCLEALSCFRHLSLSLSCFKHLSLSLSCFRHLSLSCFRHLSLSLSWFQAPNFHFHCCGSRHPTFIVTFRPQFSLSLCRHPTFNRNRDEFEQERKKSKCWLKMSCIHSLRWADPHFDNKLFQI